MQQNENPRYKWFVLTVLTIVYVFNFIDRQILVILSEPIKAELSLSDTQLGMLTGLVFALFYTTLGIPIARLADMSNRKNIVAVSLAIWSAMTAISGLAQNFVHLLLARIGVGVGEAGGSPPAHSIISDYFPPQTRATALSIYSTGIYIGILVGYVVGGLVAKNYGWRMAFYWLGVPGVLFAVFLFFSIKEPIKGQSDAQGAVTSKPSLLEVIKELFGKPTFIFLALATGFQTFINYGIGNFLPSFLSRVHQIDIATAGIVLGLAAGVGGVLGTFLGGYLADQLRNQDLRWYLWVPVLAGLLNYLPSIFLIFTPNPTIAIVSCFVTYFLTAFYLGPSIAVTHSLVNAKMRAFASSVLFFVLNFIGLGFGPLVIGMVSDALTPQYGDLSLRWAFCITFFVAAISIGLFYLASKNYLKDLEKVDF